MTPEDEHLMSFFLPTTFICFYLSSVMGIYVVPGWAARIFVNGVKTESQKMTDLTVLIFITYGV